MFRSYVKKAEAKEINDIMTSKVVYARSDQSVDKCTAMMAEMRLRHLSVFEQRKLIGINRSVRVTPPP